MTPVEIAKLLPVSEDEEEPGNLRIAIAVSQMMRKEVDQLVLYLEKDNIRGARAVLAELSGQIDKTLEHVNALAKASGLIDLKV